MSALRGHEVVSVPLADVTGVKTVDLRYLEVARTFFG
jgi:6-phosphofructokinase 1